VKRDNAYHVMRGRKGWRAKAERASRASISGDRKADVVREASRVAKARRGKLVIHGKDGRIQEERSYEA
jgi:hypothetical protein